MTSTAMPHGLVTAHGQAREEIQRADAKATTLLSLVGAALAGVIALTTRPVPVPAMVALWCSAAPILASVLLLLAAVRPRLNRTPPVGSWWWAALVGPAELAACHTNSTGDDPVTSTAVDVCVLARIAHAKYRHIQYAVTLLVAGLVVLTGALVLAVAR